MQPIGNEHLNGVAQNQGIDLHGVTIEDAKVPFYDFPAPSVLVANHDDPKAFAASSAFVNEWITGNVKVPEADQIEKLSSNGFNSEGRLGLAMLAAQTLSGLKVQAKDQAIVVKGTPGRNKWSHTVELVDNLLHLATKSAGVKARSRAGAAMRVVGLFSTAASETSANVMLCGFNLELQFDAKSKYLGASVLDFALNAEHIAGAYGLRNFAVLHALAACTDADTRARLQLGPVPTAQQASGFSLLSECIATGFSYGADGQALQLLREDLTILGLSGKSQDRLLEILAATLHLGELQFVDVDGPEGTGAAVYNADVLETVARLLGVDAEGLEQTLLYKTMISNGERIFAVQSPEQAMEQAAKLVQALYLLAHKWIIEVINIRLAPKAPKSSASDDSAKKESAGGASASAKPARVVNILCLPDTPRPSVSADGILETASERWDALVQHLNIHFDGFSDDAIKRSAGHIIPHRVPEISTVAVPIETEVTLGMLALFGEDSDNILVKEIFHIRAFHNALNENRPAFIPLAPSSRPSTLDKNLRSKRMRNLHNSEEVLSQLNNSFNDLTRVLEGSTTRWLLCSNLSGVTSPMKADKKSHDLEDDGSSAALIEAKLAAGEVAKKHFDMLLPFDRFFERYSSLFGSHQIDVSADGASQMRELFAGLGLKECIFTSNENGVHCVYLDWNDIWTLELHYRLYRDWKKSSGENEAEVAPSMLGSDFTETEDGNTAILGLQDDQFAAYGNRDMNLDEDDDDDALHGGQRDLSGSSGNPNRHSISAESSVSQVRPRHRIANRSDSYEDLMGDGNISREFKVEELKSVLLKNGKPAPAEIMPPMLPKDHGSLKRHKWLIIVKFFTFLIPDFFLRLIGKRDPETRQAWREKYTIFVMIIGISTIAVLSFVITGSVICPRSRLFSVYEMQDRSSTTSGKSAKIYSSIYGNVYNIGEMLDSNRMHDMWSFKQLIGVDLSSGFPRRPIDACPSFVRDSEFKLQDISEFGNTIKVNHQSLADEKKAQINNYLRDNTRGNVAFTVDEISKNWLATEGSVMSRKIIVDGRVYDLSAYYETVRLLGQNADAFLNSSVQVYGKKTTLPLDRHISIQASQGFVDMSNDETFMSAWKRSPDLRKCFDRMFLNGVIDDRSSFKCMFADYLMFSLAIVLFISIGIKFLSSFLMPRMIKEPGKVDRFVVIQVPCYTEDESTIRKTLNSLSMIEYDDKKKLIMVICDGMIVGRGNDRSTPQIVLDVLGVDTRIPANPLAYQAVAEGRRQHNMAKVYSGLYEHKGRLVPYIVLIKCGTVSEMVKPGNRGKRDSQMMTFRFFNKVHMKYAMSPMELELRYQLEHIIGVDPAWYEYMLMVDADTTLDKQSITQLVAYCSTDTETIGCCGETMLINEKTSFVTMIQVYEYFISHNLAKAFESLFGTVTCLPGCFSMYRIFSQSKNRPLLVDDRIIQEYGEVTVNTLHTKNLLMLGEDRYLTTLVLKTFPKSRTKFIPAAKATTLAPESFSVLLSQRRRWINSTVHNLFELLMLRELCGFCLMSMRFFIFLDLISTIIQPASVVYLFYLLYRFIDALAMGSSLNVYTASLIMLAAIYGGQILIFIVRKEFSMIVWMFIYLLAIPVFGFFLPLYSFWNMDDFSWGSTRKVTKSHTSGGTLKDGELGSSKSKKNMNEEEKFDLKNAVPHTDWNYFLAEKMVEEEEENEMNAEEIMLSPEAIPEQPTLIVKSSE